MKNERSKFKFEYWYPQYRLMLLWFIPTPFWVSYYDLYSDIVLGDVLEKVHFNSELESDNYLIYGELIK